MLKFLIEKEFKQLIRNSFLPRLILFMPCMMMLVLPWAASMEIKNINLAVVDHDHSPYSERLVEKASASSYFNLVAVSNTYQQALESMESDKTDILLEIPVQFEQELVQEGGTHVLIAANAVNSAKGGLGSSYLSAIVTAFSEELRAENAMTTTDTPQPTIRVIPQNRFNPHMNYQVFMVPALMVMLITMICGFLPALNIVSEKESGTIEQINVTPVGKFSFILAKLIPYWIIGFFVLTLCFGLARVVYGLVPAGNLLTIYLGLALYVLTVSGLGLIVSNYSNTMQQAMFVMFFFMIVLLLMSGLFTPINSMPDWARKMTCINPLKYFIQVMRQVYLKGSGIGDLLPQFTALACFAVTFNLWAVISYHKKQ